MYEISLVAAGGAIGAAARQLVNLAALRLFGSAFPVGHVEREYRGRIADGASGGLSGLERLRRRAGLRLFLGTGILGGFTTFSAFSLDAFAFGSAGAPAAALVYVAGSVGLSILALAAGLSAARLLA
jgi:CrcB protein